MKTIYLSKEGASKAAKRSSELYFSDITTSIKSLVPGEWIYLQNEKNKIKYLAYGNPLVVNSKSAIKILGEIGAEYIDPGSYIAKQISRAYEKRLIYGYKNYRLIHGAADGLIGLVVDVFENCCLVQINTAGIYNYRNHLIDKLSKIYADKKVILLNNERFSFNEQIPYEPTAQLSEDLIVLENDLTYHLSSDVIQKVGFYFDHRDNRKRMKKVLSSLKLDLCKGLDLFCYAGAWGFNMLKAGINEVVFVDQANLRDSFEANGKHNKLNNFSFIQDDVFDFLKNAISGNVKFDIICSDPPAFCKSAKEKHKAISGYDKLHNQCFKLLDKTSVFIACSCTHYVTGDEFQKSVAQAAKKNKREIQLLDTGLQGLDHPIEQTNSKSNYLKYYIYYVE